MMAKVTKKAPASKKKVASKAPASKKKVAKKTTKKKAAATAKATVSDGKTGTPLKSESVTLGAAEIDGPYAMVGFNVGHTMNVGDHEFVKGGVDVQVPVDATGQFLVPLSKLKAPMNKLQKWCDEQMTKWVETIQKDLDSEEEEDDDLLGTIGEEEEAEEDEFGLDEDEGEEEEEIELDFGEEEEEDEDDGLGLDDEEEDEEEELEIDEEDDPLGLGEL
jgi:hypothetical protein